ncbi:unnamed protein product [Lactuca saligna]|uniref:Uncharacterized protein n=1 Tax=Lactuca saligna TaxID=75948 RepID=A0AA35VSE6_LACSI|nr:unnamed protein product [Lactuca saligna]
MQNLEGPEATVRHQNEVVGRLVSNEGTSLQGKTIEEVELEEFEAFRSFSAMRKLQNERQLKKDKEWDRVLVHIDRTEDSDEERKESDPREMSQLVF